MAKKLRQQTDRIVKEYEFERLPRDIFKKLGGLDDEDTSHVGRAQQVRV